MELFFAISGISSTPQGYYEYHPDPNAPANPNFPPQLFPAPSGLSFQPNPYSNQQSQPQQPYPYQQGGARARSGRVLGGQDALSGPPAPAQQQPSLFKNTSPFNAPSALTQNTIPGAGEAAPAKTYNKKYPLTPPLLKFRIGVISDLDKDSAEPVTDSTGKRSEDKPPSTFYALLNEGNLYVQQNQDNPEQNNVRNAFYSLTICIILWPMANGFETYVSYSFFKLTLTHQITVDWDEEKIHKVRSGLSYSGRGVELSTLNVFNGRVYSCDDKTGVVYELPISDSLEIEPIPWTILADGNDTGPHGN